MSIPRNILLSNARTLLRPRMVATKPPRSSPFSTTSIPRSSSSPGNPGGPNQNPSYPAFSLKSIVPNPKVRAALWVVFVVMACGEASMW